MKGQNEREYPSWWFAVLWIGGMGMGLAAMLVVVVNVIVKVVDFVIQIVR